MNARVEYPVIRSLVIDPLPTAFIIERILGDYLIPPLEGIYTLGQAVPVMRPDRTYYQQRMDAHGEQQRAAVSHLEDVQQGTPVIDDQGEVAVTASQIPFLCSASPYPVRAIEVIERTLREVLRHYGDPDDRRLNTDPCSLYLDLLRPEWRHELEIVDQILLLVSGLRSQVKEFAGHDRWIIHFLRRQRTTMIIEQSIDWRIVQYYRLRDELREEAREQPDG
ncbi:hypothetical protein HDG34_003272 [Paraburkholderia sp. HC6.4b]|uniref:hypothetical protein n=1 Tax=unclassified Paraburkholderia TaxID=2615204 RepID=UPI00161A9A05|nr:MULTISPECIES: hypothetical protein [unclassified Paraburkholderia]MBB5409331.1 hypothetical protein [Paraburkholderia sp. HC6.4b]MBB5451059.1 hypothetical protein [Paraburkholderia sp. Kb1A]